MPERGNRRQKREKSRTRQKFHLKKKSKFSCWNSFRLHGGSTLNDSCSILLVYVCVLCTRLFFTESYCLHEHWSIKFLAFKFISVVYVCIYVYNSSKHEQNHHELVSNNKAHKNYNMKIIYYGCINRMNRAKKKKQKKRHNRNKTVATASFQI